MTAKIVEGMLLGNSGLVEPVGTYNDEYKTTLSLPSIIGAGGVKKVLRPTLNDQEQELLRRSAAAIREAVALYPER